MLRLNTWRIILVIRESSSINDVRCGVPMRSILGQLLFLFYSLLSAVERPTKVYLYADEINVKICGKTKTDIEIPAMTDLLSTKFKLESSCK